MEIEGLTFGTVVMNGLTCNTCKHRQRWQCNSKVFQYCGIRKSNRTGNGLLKIQCKTTACKVYEKDVNNEIKTIGVI